MSTLLLMTAVSAVAGVILAWMFLKAPQREDLAVERLADRLETLLPQTQCGQCTHAGCRPYALAIAEGRADINQCPPGGHATAARLARLLGREPKPVGQEYGDPEAPPMVAFIDEELCIGCALCLPACPVDAIVGAPRHTHTVIAADCTGCKLCLPPCPVDCIEMRPSAGSAPA